MIIKYLSIILLSLLINDLQAQVDSLSNSTDKSKLKEASDSISNKVAFQDSTSIQKSNVSSLIKSTIPQQDSLPELINESDLKEVSNSLYHKITFQDTTLNQGTNKKVFTPPSTSDSSYAENSPIQHDSMRITQDKSIGNNTPFPSNDTIPKRDSTIIDSVTESSIIPNSIIEDHNTGIHVTQNSTILVDPTLDTSTTLKLDTLNNSLTYNSLTYNPSIISDSIRIRDSLHIIALKEQLKETYKINQEDDLNLDLDSLLGIKEKITSNKITFYLTVLDSNTQKPLPAQIKFISIGRNGKNNAGQSKCNTEGKFNTKLTDKSHFIIKTSLIGYKPFSKEFFLEEEEITNQKFEFVCKIKKFKIGDRIKLNAVYFKQNQYQLLQKSTAQLNELVELMKQNPNLQIQLNGHTDYGGDAKKNLELSLNRVKSVRFNLIQGGIKLNRIKVKGFGGTQPATNKRDQSSRMKNRRVEFEILKI